jgi:hypothetical protein
MSLASMKSEVDVRTPIKSKKLEGLLKELAGLSKQYDKIFRKAKVIIPENFEQGKKDGFTDLEIGDMLRAVSPEMMGLQARQLRNLLAATSKHSEKIRVHAASKQLVAPTIHVVKEDKSDQSDKSISVSEPETVPVPAPEQFAAAIAAKPESEPEAEAKPEAASDNYTVKCVLRFPNIWSDVDPDVSYDMLSIIVHVRPSQKEVTVEFDITEHKKSDYWAEENIDNRVKKYGKLLNQKINRAIKEAMNRSKAEPKPSEPNQKTIITK